MIFLLREALFPVVDADSFQYARQAVSRMPSYPFPRSTAQRRRSK
jgi:hypothetical protein